MSLTVPTAGVSAGRAAQPQFETSQTGNVISAFGDAIKGFGDKIEGQRLDLEMSQLQVDMTRDMGNLRLKYENMGDPNAIDAGWAKDITDLKQSYLTGQTDTGRPRVDPKIAQRFALGFDDLAQKHAFALGTNVIALRHSQTMASDIQYRAVAAQQAAVSDPGTRDEIYRQNDQRLSERVKSGVMSPEQAAREGQKFRQDGDANAAFRMLQDDPQGLLDHLDAKELTNLTPEDRASYEAKAHNELDRRTKAAADEAKAAAKEQVASWKSDLADGLAVIEKGGLWAGADKLKDPAVAAALPDEVARIRGAIGLQADGKNINRMSLAELQKERDTLAAVPVNKPWETDKRTYLDGRIADVKKAMTTDPQGFWQSAMPDMLPALDLSSPDAAAKSLQGRIARTDHLVETGHMTAPAYLSDADKAALKPLLAKTADAGQRLDMAIALARGGQDKAIGIAKTADATPAFQQAVDLLGQGADPATVMPILRGEQKLASDVAAAPAKTARQALFNEMTHDAYAADPEAAARVQQAAEAIYADDMGTISPDDIKAGYFNDGPARTKLMDAISVAQGASRDGSGNYTIGGVQDIRGVPVALPRGIAATEVNDAVNIVGLQLSGFSDLSETPSWPTYTGQKQTPPQTGALPSPDIYRGLKAASLVPGQYPDLGANGADPETVWNTLRIEPAGKIGQDAYLLVRTTGRGVEHIVTDPTGKEYYFSLSQLNAAVHR